MTMNTYSTVAVLLDAAAELEIRERASRLQAGGAREAITTFVEKRRPDFTKAKAASRGS
jgi:hypothetical protein